MTFIPVSTVIGSLAASGVAAWIMYHTVAETKLFGGVAPSEILSLSGPHRVAQAQKFFRAEREGSDVPVILNPFRHNVPANYRNLDDFPGLGGEEEEE